MTLAEAKSRADYRFDTKNLNSYFIDALTNDRFPDWYEDYEKDYLTDLGLAVLEVGFVDIELNMSAVLEGYYYINKPDPCYWMCVKGEPFPGIYEWGDAGYIDIFGYNVEVDWKADNWREQLEEDMFNKLMAVVDKFGLQIDAPNWVGKDNNFAVFDRLAEDYRKMMGG